METKYRVEYTASVQGGRDHGQPYRTYRIMTDKIETIRFFKKVLGEEGKRYCWKRPVLTKLEVYPVDEAEALKELEAYEQIKHNGGGI